MTDLEIVKQKMSEVFTGDPRILAVYMLGSAARGTMRIDSDIDIAVMSSPATPLPASERQQIANALSYELGRTVDMGDLSSKNLVYSYEALLTGICILNNSDDAAIHAATLMGMYMQFNYDRREVIDAYRAG